MIKSVEKLLSSANCKLALCVLLVVLVLYILNRFTCSKENFMGLGNSLSSRSENAYRRVKLKYGRQKLKRMGLNPAKYSEDFIFALKITLDEVNVDIEAAAKLVDDDYDLSVSSDSGAAAGGATPTTQDHMVDLQITRNFEQLVAPTADNYSINMLGWNHRGDEGDAQSAPPTAASDDTGNLFLKTSTATISLHKLLILIKYKPRVGAGGGATANMTAFYDATILYRNKGTLLFICMWKKNNESSEFLHKSNFPLIHGFSADCQAKKKSTVPGMSVAELLESTGTTFTSSACISSGDEVPHPTDASPTGVWTNSNIATFMKTNSLSVDGQNDQVSYEGGRDYINIVKNVIFISSTHVSTPTNNISEVDDNLTDKVTNHADLLTTLGTNFTTAVIDASGGDTQVVTKNITNRIDQLNIITGVEETVGTVGYFLIDINIREMSNKFAVDNMDIVFELISTG